MNRSLAGIQKLLENHLGTISAEEARKMNEIFSKHPRSWLDEEANRRLRIALFVAATRLTGTDGKEGLKLTDELIRDQAGLPPREDDTDPVYRDYKRRAGKILLLDDEVTVIRIIGFCPASPFRWAVVERISDKQRWPMSWIVLTKFRVLDQDEADARMERTGMKWKSPARL